MTSVRLEQLRGRLAALEYAHTPRDVADAMRAEGLAVSDASLLETVDALRRHSEGAGPLEALLREPSVTDVLVNGADQVYVDRGGGLEMTAVSFADDAEVRRLAQRLAASAGRRLDDALPFADVRLADGTRFHAVLGSVARPGTCLSLRVPARRGFSLADFVSHGSLSASGARLLERAVAAKLAFLVTGGTGSGKTTLLAALLGLVPPSERIVIVEDSRELAPAHPHVVSLEARPANAELAGAVTLTDLVRQSLRMRPDRLVVGEVRGAEVCDLLTAMNTGHEGGCGTLHANSAADVPARIEALASLGGLGREAVHAQLAAALQLVVHVARKQNGRREVAEVSVLRRDEASGLVGTIPAVRFVDGRTELGAGAGLLDALMGTAP